MGSVEVGTHRLLRRVVLRLWYHEFAVFPSSGVGVLCDMRAQLIHATVFVGIEVRATNFAVAADASAGWGVWRDGEVDEEIALCQMV